MGKRRHQKNEGRSVVEFATEKIFLYDAD